MTKGMMKRMATVAVAASLMIPGMAAAQAAPAAGKDLVQVATEAGSFKTLLAAVQAAGLVDVLKGPGPFTVFAPTDEAFAKLPAGALDALLADKEKLAAVLTYHVIPGRVTAGDVVASGGAKPKTVQGDMLTIAVKGGKVHVDGATVTAADVMASNGVIHVIDSVVMPGWDAKSGMR